MSLIAPVEDGKIVSTASQESAAKKKSTSGVNSVVDSDTFLTMLVAEMQNQDPLEPTSNTEWVAQYATFTMVEEMDEMGKSMDLMRANSLIGENVIMKVTSESTGDTNYVQGVVDYVVFENGKAYLYINDEAYSMDDLDTVATPEYMEGYNKSTDFVSKFAKLPTIANLTTSHGKQVQELWTMYDGMTDYQKGFIGEAYVQALKKYKEAMEGMGITIKDAPEPVTLDSIYNALNSKIDSVMTGLSGISTSVGGISTSVGNISNNVGSIAQAGKEGKVTDDAIDALLTDNDKEAGKTEAVTGTSDSSDKETSDSSSSDSGDHVSSSSEASSGSSGTSESSSSSGSSDSDSSGDDSGSDGDDGE